MTVAAMVAWAMAQQGKGYSEMPGLRCGPNSFDCSGLVYQACVNGNVRPPGGTGIGCSTTYSQWADKDTNGNVLIPAGSAFELGDLIYFDNGDGGPQPGHVGISLGDGTMINALNTQYGVLVCPESWGGTAMGGIRVPADPGNVTLVKNWIKDGVKGAWEGIAGALDAGGSLAGNNPLNSAASGAAAMGQLGKIAGKLSDPAFTKRVGKAALAGLVGLVALLTLREGMNANE